MIHKERKITGEYTVEGCPSCGAAETRKYAPGDVLFGPAEKCSSCGGAMRIEKIYGETITY